MSSTWYEETVVEGEQRENKVLWLMVVNKSFYSTATANAAEYELVFLTADFQFVISSLREHIYLSRNTRTMAMPFAFVPRKVEKTIRVQASSSNAGSSKSAAPTESVRDFTSSAALAQPVVTKDSWKGKKKATTNDLTSLPGEHYAILICLALSDHSFWADRDLHRTVERQSEGCAC